MKTFFSISMVMMALFKASAMAGSACPDLPCPAPPPGFEYRDPVFDESGCKVECGRLSRVHPVCPALPCPAPPPGFEYRNPVFDENGCKVECGVLSRVHPVCPPLPCAPPPPGCRYEDRTIDENGCILDCGKLRCVQLPAKPRRPRMPEADYFISE